MKIIIRRDRALFLLKITYLVRGNISRFAGSGEPVLKKEIYIIHIGSLYFFSNDASAMFFTFASLCA